MKQKTKLIRHTLRACTLAGLTLAVSGCSHPELVKAIPTIWKAQRNARKSLIGKRIEAAKMGMAPVYIYKMKKDYSQHVPVTMDAARTRVVSYPAPTDLKTNGKLAVPTPLDNGFWLDNRGINENVAFLSYTYEEYSQLTEAPTSEELMKHIIDNDPLTEIHYCGSRNEFTDIVAELNALIAERYSK